MSTPRNTSNKALAILTRLAALESDDPDVRALSAEAARFLSGPRHYIVKGRRPGDDCETMGHVKCSADSNPVNVFVEETLYAKGDLPEGWHSDETGGPYGDGYVYDAVFYEILGSPIYPSDEEPAAVE